VFEKFTVAGSSSAQLSMSALDELRDWCAAEHGRQARVARELKVEPHVSRDLVNDWLFERKKPSLEQYFALQTFLKEVAAPKMINKKRRRV
jgi:hypothetical protein